MTQQAMKPTAGDMFLWAKGAKTGLIKGEAQDSQHKGEIDVLSWSWGMETKTDIATGQAAGKGRMHELKIVKRVDSASTALMLALRTNEVILKAVLTLRKSGQTPLEYFKVTIENGHVTSLTIDGGDASGAAAVTERVSFTFDKVTVDYTPQGNDGRPLGGMTFIDQWNP